MSLSVLLIIVLIMFLIGSLPTWPHSRGWSYYPAMVIGAITIAALVLMHLGRI